MLFQAQATNSELGVHCPGADAFLEAYQSLGYKLFDNADKPFNLNIVGWRYKYRRPNKYDDFIAIYYKVNDFWKEVSWEATTVPGTPYLTNPIHPKGAAILVPGQYRHAYALGKHKGKYEALVQVGKVKVYRDNNYDGNIDIDESSIMEGYFGINIHRGGLVDTWIGRNSAGCQVFKTQAGYDTFMHYIRSASGYWGRTFTYTLLEF